MAEEIDKFVEEFHNLDGVAVGQKKQSLFLLFQKNPLLNDEAILDALTSRLVPRTHLERIFFVDFLIYYRRFNELYSEFLKGDEIVVSKVSKANWFFQLAFERIGGTFVTQILSTVSYSIRLKILKKLVLVLNEKQADEIFDALFARYGVFMASNVLTGCSSSKIEEILKNQPIKLWTSQLKLLYKKKPDLLYIYFDERAKYEGGTKWLNNDSILKFIASQNSLMFCNLLVKYKFEYSRIGKRTTKKLVREEKEKIISSPDLFQKNLNKARLVRTLGADFKQFYFNLYPRTIKEVHSDYSPHMMLIRYYPKHRQFELFKNTFDQIFQTKLEMQDNLIGNKLSMITNNDEREKWARMKHQHDEKDVYLKYFKAENCIAAIRSKFNSSSRLDSRIANIAIITETCLINKNWNSLLTVCELLCTRFWNDDKRLHIKFLQTLTAESNIFAFDHLEEAHWNYIKTIISKQDFKTSPSFNVLPIILKYLQFVHKTNGGAVENEFLNLAKQSCWIHKLYNELDHNLPKNNKKFCKILLLILIRNASLLIEEDTSLKWADINLIVECTKHNRRNKADPIIILEHLRLIESVKSVLVDKNRAKHNNQILGSAIEILICTQKSNEIIEELTHLFWKNFEYFPTLSVLKWFLKFNLLIVADYIDKIMPAVTGEFCDFWDRLRDIKKIWNIFKCYTHLSFDKNIVDYCLKSLNDENFSKKSDLVQPLSLLMPAQDFVQLVEKYKPDSTTVDLENSAENELFQIQRLMLKSFVDVKEPELVLPLILQFCSGDYVASTLSCLYSCLYRIPENKLKAILDRLCTTGAVSVKKHGFYFACVTHDEASLFASLKACQLSQSIAMTYQHFVKNPSEPIWGLLETKLKKLDKNDYFTIQVLINTPAPNRYKSKYFVTAYQVFKNQNNKYTHVLVDKLQKETIGELDKQFLSNLKEDFLIMKKSEKIFASYLVYSQDTAKFDVVFDALRTFKGKNWSFRAQEPREKLQEFIYIICDYYIESEDTNENLPTTFLDGFQNIFPPVEVFQEYLTILMMKLKTYKVADICKEVVNLNKKLITEFGRPVINIFADCLNMRLRKFCKSEEEVFEFYFLLFKYRQGIDDVLLLLNLLPKTKPELADCAKFYDNIFEVLQQIDDEKVKVHVNLLLRQ